MTVYDRAASLLSRTFASDVFTDGTLTRSGPHGGFDPVTSLVIASEGLQTPCRAVVKEVTTKSLDGTLVSNTVVTLDVEPYEGDTLTIGQDTYTIQAVTRVAPVGTALLYRAVVAK